MIAEWNNVRDATIVNGAIVPGALIPAPDSFPIDLGFFAAQSGNFSIAWDAVPSQSAENVVTGLSSGTPSAFTDFACIARFSTAGVIDSYNGSGYAALASVPYTAGQSFHFRMDVRVPTHTYDVYVTPSGQSEVLLGSNYAFRSSQAAVASLDHLGKMIVAGDVTITNMAVGLSLSPAKFTQTNTFYTATMTGGTRTLSPALYARTTVFYSPTVSLDGSSLTGLYPKSMNDPMFTNMTERTSGSLLSLTNGQTLSNQSWLNDTTPNWSVSMASNTTCNIWRMKTREGPRFTGQTNTAFNYLYLESFGIDPSDHADGYQWEGGNNSVTFKHCHFRTGNGGFTCGFAADGSTGTLYFEDCIWTCAPGGGNGLVLYADAGWGTASSSSLQLWEITSHQLFSAHSSALR